MVARLTVLSKEDLGSIHEATLQILEESGFLLSHSQAREILQGRGGRVQGNRVRLPADCVEWALAQCPPQVTIWGRAGHQVVLGDGNTHWHNLGGARDLYDAAADQYRPAVVQDVRDSARLLDALDGVTAVTPLFTPQDVPAPLMLLAMYRHTLPHTTRPIHGPGAQTAAEVRYFARMAAVIGSPAEVLSMGISPISPLFFPDDITEAIMETARLGIPFGPLPCPTAGATAPLSLAGALAQQNAEVLAAVVLAQAVRPGLPIIYCGRLSIMEPRTGTSIWGGVETGLVSAATVQLAHHYGLPVNVYGFATNAHRLNLQNGYERALNAVIPALAGADELSGIGELEAGVAGSYAQIVCDNEIAASVRRLRRSFAVDEDSLAVAVIAAVMEDSRNFLGQRHTVRHLRAGEILLPRLAERRDRQAWDETGRDSLLERAQQEAERLLAEHEVTPLTEEQERSLDAIVAEAAQALL